MSGVTHIQGRAPNVILSNDVRSGTLTHPKRGVPGALERTMKKMTDTTEFPYIFPKEGTSRRAMNPANLEKWADQPWISHPTVGGGAQVPPATRMRTRELWDRTRLRGGAFEKFMEDSKRVVEQEPHPGVYNLLGSRDSETADGIKFRGAPPVEFSELLSGPLGQKWPPLRYKHEFFARYLPRGPSLQYLEIDPGPMYAITATNGTDSVEASAGSLLAVTRAYNQLATESNSVDGGAASDAHLNASLLAHREREMHNLPSVIPAGTFKKGSIESTYSSFMQNLGGSSDQAVDMGQSIGQQFSGPRSVPLDFTSVGPNQAVVSAMGEGPFAAQLNGALLGRTRPGEGPTLANEGLSGGAVFSEGATGLVGGSNARIQTVIHPLDSFPGTKRLVADEKVAQIDAERLRRKVVASAVKRDILLGRIHPHGALGVDHIDNVESAVFGEMAERRRLNRDIALNAAAQREAKLMLHQQSIARRGFDILRPATVGELPQTLRVEPTSLTTGTDARASRDDGVKFLQNLVRAKDHMPEGQTTMRAVTGEQTKFFIGSRDKVVRTENITRQSTRTAYNILTGTALPQPIQAVLSSSQQQQH
jgi:hypothetical protein